jgi:hypothetical protein
MLNAILVDIIRVKYHSIQMPFWLNIIIVESILPVCHFGLIICRQIIILAEWHFGKIGFWLDVILLIAILLNVTALCIALPVSMRLFHPVNSLVVSRNL